MLSKLDKWLQGRTFIVVTHRGLLLNLVNRVIVMDSGVIVADGPKEKVLLPPSQKGKNNA